MASDNNTDIDKSTATPGGKSPLKTSPETTATPLPKLPPPEASTTSVATPGSVSKDSLPTSCLPDTDLISVPSYSRWFSWDNIHQCELRFLPEFFDGRSPSKNPKIYKYYRNAIVQRYRENPTRRITFTEVRKTIIGDVGSIRRVFDFLETWGLINYTASTSKPPQLKWEDKETKSASASNAQGADAAAASASASATGSADSATPKKRLCSGCKALCTIACFACDKYDLTLCARCYVRGNYRVGVNSSDFRRVEISEEVKTDWTDKETLHLLEAVMHYGDDWKKVSEHVGGRSEKECVARFIKLPFGEQYVGPPESAEVDSELGSRDSSLPSKRMRLTPLADSSNPILAQAAFLSALVGVEVAEVASRAAIVTLSDCSDVQNIENLKPLSAGAKNQESDNASNGDTINPRDSALVQVQSQLEKEEDDMERVLSGIAVQMKELQEKIVHFEELDLQVEKGWQQLQQLKNLLFVDQLNLIFHKAAAKKTGESARDSIKGE